MFFFSAVASSAESAATADSKYESELVAQAERQNLADDPYWAILMQYRPRWFAGVKSEIEARAFFNAENGRTDPRAELDATIRSFFAPPSIRAATGASGDAPVQHPQCFFIDRYTWLKEKLHFDPGRLPERECPEYNEWHAALDPDSVTLVFSSYFMSNPSSAFGHTLLRLNHRGHSRDEKLLDYGVSYAANPTTRNALLYGVMGLVGGFDGLFSNLPYFMKVEEYSSVESRDLWEYDLSLTPAQVDRLVRHLWTVGHISTPYYFFDKNCAFMILALLDAGRPDLKLAAQINKSWWVIPSDTVRAVVSRPGLVTKVSVRPSLAFRISDQRARLSGDDDDLFLAIIGDQTLAAERLRAVLRSKNAARILDLVSDYLRYLKIKNKNVLPAEYAALQTEILNARSELPDKPPVVEFSPEQYAQERPDFGHDTARFAVGGGYNSLNKDFVELGVRPAFHDLNSSAIGYPKGAQIEFLDLNARYSPTPRLFRFEKISLLSIVALSPWDRVFKKISWAGRLGADPVRDFDCQDCLEYKTNLGGGLSVGLGPRVLLFGLVKAELGFGAQYHPGYRLGPGADVGTLLTLSDRLGLLLNGHYSHPLLGYTPAFFTGSGEARVTVSRDFEVRIGFNAYPISREGKLQLDFYL